MKINESSGNYIAINENPIVLCSYGDTMADAFKQMAKLLKKNQDSLPFSSVSAVRSSYDENVHYVTVYI